MRFRSSAPAIICSAIFVVISAVSLLSYAISHRMVDVFEKSQFFLMGEIARSKLQDAEAKALSTAETVAAMPQVQKAFAEKKREELMEAANGPFTVLQEKYGVRSENFYFPPAETFLRVHRPKDFGDDMSSYRKMVVDP